MSAENALSRAIRLKRPEDALYWFARMRDDGKGLPAITRRLFISSLRDNLNIDLMRVAFADTGSKTPAVDPQQLVVDLAMSEKLWSVQEGRNLLKIIDSTHNENRLVYRGYSDSELVSGFDILLDAMTDDLASNFLGLSSIVNESLDRNSHGYPLACNELIEKLSQYTRGSAIAGLIPIVTDIGACGVKSLARETLVWLLVTWLVTGPWGQPEVFECNAVDRVRFAVAARIKQEPEPIPSWATREDRRFDGSWDSYQNMSAMVQRYARLDPDDEGVLLQTKNGIWKPVIKEEDGIYMVQSENDIRKFYEVNLAAMLCSCPAYSQRQTPCKHIKAARILDESKMPFEVQ